MFPITRLTLTSGKRTRPAKFVYITEQTHPVVPPAPEQTPSFSKHSPHLPHNYP